MTLREVQVQGTARLTEAGVEDSAFEAACLLECATGFTRGQCLCRAAEHMPQSAEMQFFAMVARRTSGEPLQYILGKWPFYGRDFFVGKGVLIPRPETEELVEKAIAVLKNKPRSTVFDLCAGSGCIGLTIAKEVPACDVYLFEKYDAAFGYLCKNAGTLQVPNAHVLQADIFNDVPPNGMQADLLLSNPPYIPKAELSALQKEVRREPQTALDGGADGLEFYRAIQQKWSPFVKKGGMLLMECGDGQGQSVADLFQSSAVQTKVLFDFQNIDRFVQVIV